MTTATMDPPATGTEQTKTWTLREIEKQRATLADLRQRVEDLTTREEEIQGQVATALADGEDASDLKAELAETRELREDLVAVEPVLAARIQARHHLALQALAADRLQAIKKKVGGLVGEAPRRAEKARELAEKLVAQLDWLADVKGRRGVLDAEARLLEAAFGLERPDFKSFDADPARAWLAVKRSVNRVQPKADRVVLSIRRATQPGEFHRAARKLVSVLGNFDETTPTPDLVADLKELDRAAED